MFKGAPPTNFIRAKNLRKNMTGAEKKVWEKLKNNQLQGFKFRRQHPIQNFIVDFYCHKLKLVIEIDGKYHDSNNQQKLDKERTSIIKFQKLKVLRITNEEVFKNIDEVIQKIEKEILDINIQCEINSSE